MEIEPETLFSFLGVVITALLTYAAARAQAKSKSETMTQKSTEGQMQSLADQVIVVMDKGFASRDRKIGALDSRVQVLERKDDAWLRHVLDWRKNHPDRSQWPTPPLEVRSDLPD